MEKTPLELYETAYKYHYVENKISEAVSIYELLIREFPNSNECGYATIQLQKIKVSNLSGNLNKKQSSLHPIGAMGFIVGCISLLFCGVTAYYFKNQIAIERTATAQALDAFGKILTKQNTEASSILNDLKKNFPNNTFPFELSAFLDKKDQEIKEIPKSEVTQSSIDKVQNAIGEADSQVTKDTIVRSQLVTENRPHFANAETTELVHSKKQIVSDKIMLKKNKDSSEKVKMSTIQEKSKANKKSNKNLFIVNPDSLSYF